MVDFAKKNQERRERQESKEEQHIMTVTALAKKERATIVPYEFDSPALASKEEVEELKEMFTENLAEGEIPQLASTRLPSGEGDKIKIVKAGEIVDEVEELTGVILHFIPLQKACYKKPYSKNDPKVPPDCSSKDGITGEGDPGGSCVKCEFNRYNTAHNGGKGKLCKDIMTVFLLLPEHVMPIRIPLPPTSHKPFKTYRNDLTDLRRGTYYGVVTRAKIVNNEYAVVNWLFEGTLGPEAKAAMKSYRNDLMRIMMGQKIDSDDFEAVATEETSGADGEHGYTHQTYETTATYVAPAPGVATDTDEPF